MPQSAAPKRPALVRDLALGLAFVGGFVDTAGFIGLDGFFTNHVTSNLVLLGAKLAAHRADGVTAKLVAVPVFCASVAFVAFCERRFGRGPRVLRAMLRLQALGLAAFTAVAAWGLDLGPEVSDSGPYLLTCCVGVAAMGLQAGTMRQLLPHMAPTTMMTGNLTAAMLAVGQSLAGAPRAGVLVRLATSARTLAAFIGGAATACLGMQRIGFACCALPALFVLLLAERAEAPRPA